MSSYAMQEEDDDLDINDLNISVGDLSNQESSDVLDPARKVPFTIKKVTVRKQYEDPQDKHSKVLVTRLAIQSKIGEAGTNGEGANAGRILFPEFIIAFDKESKTGEWWEKKARAPFKELLVALGYDPAAPPTIDREFIDGLIDRDYLADIKVRKVQEKTDEINPKTGKNVYKDTGEFQNELGNYRPA